jgi:hypothetical protein
MSTKSVEICNHCGRSVAVGSGRFVNRVPDCNDVETRIANNLQYPLGDFVCEECDGKGSSSEYDTPPKGRVNGNSPY